MHGARRLMLAAVAILWLAGAAAAQITVIEEKNGKEIACGMSGLVTTENDCDGQPYQYVFVGVITRVTDTPNAYGAQYGEEKRLEIRPEEVFRGNPPAVLTVTTNQTECAPDQKVGDSWLFFVAVEKGKPLVVDVYTSGSAPVEQAAATLATLRRLRTMSDRGILRGNLQREVTVEEEGVKVRGNEPVASHRVVAEREPDHKQFFATSDAGGKFEFEPLPPGKYRITPDDLYQWGTRSEEHTLAARECTDFLFEFKPDGRLRGRVTRPDGNPLSGANVVAVSGDEDRGHSYYYGTSTSDGSFVIKDVPPGNYLLGLDLNLVGNDESKAVYYPGVRSPANATALTIGLGEHRDHLDFAVPPAAPK